MISFFLLKRKKVQLGKNRTKFKKNVKKKLLYENKQNWYKTQRNIVLCNIMSQYINISIAWYINRNFNCSGKNGYVFNLQKKIDFVIQKTTTVLLFTVKTKTMSISNYFTLKLSQEIKNKKLNYEVHLSIVIMNNH